MSQEKENKQYISSDLEVKRSDCIEQIMRFSQLFVINVIINTYCFFLLKQDFTRININ